MRSNLVDIVTDGGTADGVPSDPVATQLSNLPKIVSDRYLYRATLRFARVWRQNQTEILHLAATNILTTLLMEALVRTAFARIFHLHSSYEFFISSDDGFRLNRQSLTNMWITGLTSLFGGPVLFLPSRSQRYLFFVLFGLLVSLIGQGFVAITLGLAGTGVAGGILTRLAFDFCYTGTIKFGLFEIARKPLLSAPPRISLRIGGIRLTQDFATTVIRVSLLNAFRLKG